MKKGLILLSIFFLVNLSLKSQNEDKITLTGKVDGGLRVACEGFYLTGDFYFKASATNTLSLKIDHGICTPIQLNTDISNDQNYIITVTPLGETSKIEYEEGKINIGRTEGKEVDVMTEIQYIDGQGRPTELVRVGISPNHQDLVSFQEYDKYGRTGALWLPIIVSANKGKYVENDILESTATNFYGDGSPYSYPEYEKSPLSRVLFQYGPGDAWRSNPTRLTYETNSSGNSCLFFKVVNNSLVKIGFYPIGSLYGFKKRDENGNTSSEFKDKLNQVVLSRQTTTDTIRGQVRITNYDTYYVYDDFDNLCYVLPPLLSDKLTASSPNMSDTSEAMKQYAYIYKYDERNRCTQKQLPGCEPIYYVYDKADRLILSQDGEQRKSKLWSFSKYDALGRILMTGVQQISKTKEQLIDQYKDVLIVEKVEGNYYGYSWNTMPDVDYQGVLTVNHYDNYNHLLEQGFSGMLDYQKKQEYGECYIGGLKEYSAKGLLTGTRVKLLDDPSKEIVTALYYDERGRVIQTKKLNHLNEIETEYTAYNFTGQPIKVLKESPLTTTFQVIENDKYVGDLSQINELQEYTYDHAGRLKDVIRNGIKITSNTYNELGQLEKVNQANLLNTAYTYNIRGWTKTLNETKTGFQQTLFYEDGVDEKNYNGNISRMKYDYSGQNPMDFAYTYDGLNRLTNAMTNIKGKETSEHVSYDKHGNVFGIIRMQDGIHTSVLSTAYSGNQAASLSNDPFSIVPGVVQYTEAESFFSYNANGSLIKDSGRGIATIKYNYLNLPEVIQFSNGNMTYYTYAADGTKLRTKHLTAKVGIVQPITDGDIRELKPSDILSTLVTDYVGNIIYEDQTVGYGKPDIRVMFDGGYDYYATGRSGMERMTHKSTSYYLKDYLGNNRDVVSKSGSIAPHTEYLPFGTPLKSGGDRFKYSDKEFDEMHGLNMYDFHARQYDPLLVRFTSVDPLAEKYYSWSPYVYCLNNPLKYVDPDGRDPGDVFKSKDAAAKDWGQYYNSASILNRREYASQIYEIGSGYGRNRKVQGYSYSVANEGSLDGAKPSVAPDGTIVVGSIHSHGNYLPDYGEGNNNFSDDDKDSANANQDPQYVATPNGSLKEYDPNASDKDGNKGTIRTVGENLPSDPNDPSRKNTIDPKVNPNLKYNPNTENK